MIHFFLSYLLIWINKWHYIPKICAHIWYSACEVSHFSCWARRGSNECCAKHFNTALMRLPFILFVRYICTITLYTVLVNMYILLYLYLLYPLVCDILNIKWMVQRELRKLFHYRPPGAGLTSAGGARPNKCVLTYYSFKVIGNPLVDYLASPQLPLLPKRTF